ncbi:MAG TPA: hypothetical protein VFD63_07070 [Pyrinomonadaceae bacterium]|nr:hypothetical protein [Pyrinomonadaceae bacterium]
MNPFELKNLASDPGNEKTVRSMRQLLTRIPAEPAASDGPRVTP